MKGAEKRMIIAGIGRNNHDDSVCVYADGEIKYSKYEREINEKSALAFDWWFYEKIKSWGFKLEDINLFVETSRGSFYHQGLWRLPLNGKTMYESTRLKKIILDHHTAHLHANVNYIPGLVQGIVIDGMGSGGHTVLIDDTKNIYRYFECTPASVYANIVRPMNLITPEQAHEPGVYGAGKVMGLINYGEFNKNIFKKIKNLNLESISSILDYKYKENNKEWWDFLKAVDEVCYNYILKNFSMLNKNIPIVYSGGAALNVEWNRRLKKEGYNLLIDPAVNDSGISLGLVYFGLYYLNIKKTKIKNFPYFQDDETPKSYPSQKTIKEAAELLSKGKIVGWYQGKGEYGPRALGNRSILMDPRIKNGKKILNEKVKKREWWRPYGASVLEEKADKYFDINYSPYMLFNCKVKNNNLPSITHVDKTCRPQTVNKGQNKYFYDLIHSFYEITGTPILLNTSLNLGGKPICSTIKDAKEVLKITNLDFLCVGNSIYSKENEIL